MNVFSAPEAQAGQDSVKIDEWAAGIILFFLFSGGQYPTFKGPKIVFS